MLNSLRVAFSGLTAAGKTTHSLRLARELGAEWFGATELLAELAGVPSDGSPGLWLRHGAAIESKRDGDELDLELDRRLVERFERSDGIVADAWALPWLASVPMVRVWLRSDLRSRSMKCVTSQLPDRQLGVEEATEHISKKDGSTRERFRRLYDFDLFEEHEAFDAVLDNSRYISKPTLDEAAAGVESFAPIVLAAVRLAAGRASDEDHSILKRAPQDVVQRTRTIDS